MGHQKTVSATRATASCVVSSRRHIFSLNTYFVFPPMISFRFWDEKEGALVLATVRWPRFLSRLPLPLVFWCLNRARAGLPSRRYTFLFFYQRHVNQMVAKALRCDRIFCEEAKQIVRHDTA